VKIDLHIHTRTGSDGNLTIEEVFQEAKNRNIDLISITDHDSIACQEKSYRTGEKTWHVVHHGSGIKRDFPLSRGR
jgi:predicted metal-dependent phosphoesterase TrpH